MKKKQEVKLPKKDGVAKVREVAEKLRNQQPSPELVGALKERPSKSEDKPLRKIASSKRAPESDIGI
jgi:hypothetical protein